MTQILWQSHFSHLRYVWSTSPATNVAAADVCSATPADARYATWKHRMVTIALPCVYIAIQYELRIVSIIHSDCISQ